MSRRHRRHDRQDRQERRDRQRRDRRRRDRDRTPAGAADVELQPRTSRHTKRRPAPHVEGAEPGSAVLQPADRQRVYVTAGATTALATIGPGLDHAVVQEGAAWRLTLPRSDEVLALLPVVLAVAGLGIAAVLTFGLLAGTPGGDRRPNTGGVVVAGPGGQIERRSPDPGAVYTPRPEEGVIVDGQLLFVKSGNVWVAEGRSLRRLTDTGRDSSPTWTPDGSRIYLLERRSASARLAVDGDTRPYTLEYLNLVATDARGKDRVQIKDALYRAGSTDRQRFFTWLLQPDLSPDGTQVALISDWPEPLRRDPTLSLVGTDGGTIRNLDLPSQRPFGHTDPAWSPDGSTIAYTYNDREQGSPVGQPRIILYSVAAGTTRPLTGPGYSQPDWSPDGRFIVAVRTQADGRDVVVLDAATGAEKGRLTRDGASFAPVWSPTSGQIAYLHVDQDGTDLRILSLSAADDFRVTQDKAVTTGSGLDPGSPPAWHIPGTAPGPPPN